MKIVHKIIGLLFVVVLLVSTTSFAPADPQPKPTDDDPTIMYWFFLRIKIDKSKKEYNIIGTGSRLESGDIERFRQQLWWGISRGQMAVGPFLDQEEATNARLLYRKNRKSVPQQLATADPNRELHWFLINFQGRQRSAAYKMQRMPARLASGGINEFLDALYEGVTFEHLAIGPFWDYNQAEMAKYMYRANE